MISKTVSTPSRHMTFEQYLALEVVSPARYEYLAGELFAKADTNVQHDAIVARLSQAVVAHGDRALWNVFKSDMGVRIKSGAREYFYYPDLLVISMDDRDNDRHMDGSDGMHYVRSPKLIVEVSSQLTLSIDRREKSMVYREIGTLEEYVVIAQEDSEVTIYRRRENWVPLVLNALDAVVEFESIGLSLPLAELYRDAPSK